MKIYGGDTVETADGRQGRVKSSRFSLVGRETEYDLDTGARVGDGEIVRIIEHARHGYRPGGGQRGHCRRCGIVKGEHSL